MTKKEPTIEELLALASKPAHPRDDAVLDDVKEWIMQEGIKPGEYPIQSSTAYQLYSRWSVAPYDRIKFGTLMNKYFKRNNKGFLVLEESVERARSKILSEIGERRRGKKAKKIQRAQ